MLDPSPAPAPASLGASLPSPGQLVQGASLTSPDGRFQLVMQNDGNLVLYDPSGRPLWASGTSNTSGTFLVPQAPPGSPPGAGTVNFGGQFVNYAVMQDDGNLVIYQTYAPGQAGPIWNTGTPGNGPSTLVLDSNGTLSVRRNSDGQVTWSVRSPAFPCSRSVRPGLGRRSGR